MVQAGVYQLPGHDAPPFFHSALQGSQVAVAELFRMVGAQPIQYCPGGDVGLRFQPSQDILPYSLEGVWRSATQLRHSASGSVRPPASKSAKFRRLVPLDSMGASPPERNQSQKGIVNLPAPVTATSATSSATDTQAIRDMGNPVSHVFIVSPNPLVAGNTWPPHRALQPAFRYTAPASSSSSTGRRSSTPAAPLPRRTGPGPCPRGRCGR